MSSNCDRLFNWYIENLNVASENKFKHLTQIHHLDHLTKGKYAKIWEYVVKHVRTRSYVEKIRNVLRKKHIMDSLDKMQVNPTDVDLEVATNKVNNLDGRRQYLEQTLTDMEGRILSRKHELEVIEHDIEKLKEMYEILDTFKDQCMDKCLQYKKFHQNLAYILAELNRFQKSFQPGDTSLIVKKGKKYNLSEGKLFNAHDLLDHMKSIFRTSLVDNSPILLDVAKILKKEVDQVLTFDNFIDIFPPVKTEVQKNLENFQEFANQSFEYFEHKEAAQLIKEMKFIHIQESYETNIISKKVNNLLKSKENISLHTYTNSGLSCLSTLSYSSQSELFKKLSEIKAITKGIEYLEATIKVQENDTNKLLIQNAIHKKECKDIQTVLSDAYRMFDSIHWLLLENLKSFDIVSSQINNVSSFAEKVFLSIPMFKKQIEEYQKTFRPDRQNMWVYCTKAKLLQPIIEEFRMHHSIPNISFLRAYSVHSVMSTDVVVERCLSLNASVKNKESDNSDFFADEFKSGTGMECYLTQDLFLSKLQLYIDQMKSDILKSNETMKECEVSCNEFPIFLNDWWNQDAQFISNIEAEGMSLKTWLNLINVLPES